MFYPLIIAMIFALASGSPQETTDEKPQDDQRHPFYRILKNESAFDNNGSYYFHFETENGINRTESGSPLSLPGENKPIGQQGTFSYPLPNGEIFSLKFVANENGYHPESAFLPLSPVFPHPIPQFVLDQIVFAAKEDAERAQRGEDAQ